MTNTIVDTLRAATSLLRRDGWTQEMYGPVDPTSRQSRCVGQAIRAAAHANGDLERPLTHETTQQVVAAQDRGDEACDAVAATILAGRRKPANIAATRSRPLERPARPHHRRRAQRPRPDHHPTGDPMTPTDMIQCLRDAQALLRRDGWRQGDWGPASPEECGPRCLGGAVLAVPVRNGALCRAYEELSNAIWEEGGGLGVVSFNDAPGRTEAEVHDLLDRTINRLETQ